jgi:hypothetical protein
MCVTDAGHTMLKRLWRAVSAWISTFKSEVLAVECPTLHDSSSKRESAALWHRNAVCAVWATQLFLRPGPKLKKKKNRLLLP